MPVVVMIVTADNLEQTIQQAKDNGKRILALSPHTMKRRSLRATEYETTVYTLVLQ